MRLCRADRFITGAGHDTNCTGTTLTGIKLHVLICKYKFSRFFFFFKYQQLYPPRCSLCVVAAVLSCVSVTRQICQAAEWRLSQWSLQSEVAAEHGCESSRVTTDLIFPLFSFSFSFFTCVAAVALIVLCVCQEWTWVCRERGSVEKALCPWLRLGADSESSVTVRSRVSSPSPRLRRRPASEISGSDKRTLEEDVEEKEMRGVEALWGLFVVACRCRYKLWTLPQ